jgi:iron(III) transport system permease protein
VTLPLISPHIWAAAIFVFIFAMSNYSVSDLLRVNTFPIEIFIQFSAYYNEARATALSIPLVAILILFIGLQRLHMKDRSYVTLGTGFRAGAVHSLGRWKGAAFAFIATVLVLAVVVPTVDLVAISGSVSTYAAAVKTAHRQILSSVILAAAAATLMTALAFVIAYCIERSSGPFKRTLDYASLIPFAVPAVVLGIGLTTIWNRPALGLIYGTPVIVVIGYTARFIPFVVRAAGSNIKQMRPRLEEAAMLTHASWIKRAVRIVIPLCRPGLVAGWAIAFVLSMGELATTLLVTPPGEATLPIRIYTLLHYGAHQLVAALCVILVVVTLIPVLLVMSFGGFRGFAARNR